MSSSTNNRPVFKQSKGSKAAIIRPVNRRDGKQSFVRIDAAQEAVRPNRVLQLEDYVAQIRGYAEVEVPDAQQTSAPAEKQSTPTPVEATVALPAASEAQAKTRIVRDTARKQLNSSAELTEADYLNVLKAVAKLDSGYEWIAESNRSAAAQSKEIASQLEEATEPQPVEVQTTTQPVSQELVNDIAAAIASVLTNRSESEMSEKIVQEPSTPAPEPIVAEQGSTRIAPAPSPIVETSPLTVSAFAAATPLQEEDSLRLSPELPKPEYTLPVTDHELAAQAKPELEQQDTDTSHIISLTAAAWDVPAFRWPVVSDQILAVKSVLGGLAANCESMLSPFGKTIAVTAPTRGQGTTTMSITLSRLFASHGKRVLLIDGDIMQPQLSKQIGISGVSWFRNCGSVSPVGESIIHGQNSGVCVMPLDAPISNVDPYSDPIFDQLEARVDKVRGEFDLIVIDSGPVWQIVDEMSSDSHLIDVAMLVNQDTHSNGFSEARERLMDRGVFKFIAAQNAFARRAG